MKKPILTPRLAAAAGYARENSFVADIGTDHAYLPAALLLEGKIRGAVASDINPGPLERASENLKKYRLENLVRLVLTDGLEGIYHHRPEDIFILGMGGELIAEIIKRAEWTKNTNIRLVLQPMTAADKLREFLIENGFQIIDECLAKEKKIYQIMVAEYTGEKSEYSPAEIFYGKINIEKNTPLLKEYAALQEKNFTIRRDGKNKAALDTSYEDYIILETRKIIKDSRRMAEKRGKNDG